jgi:hypothetical protein
MSNYVTISQLTSIVTNPLAVMIELLDKIPLLSFLDGYPEPAFILCSKFSPYTHSLLYGNAALRSLILGDESAILNDDVFFDALCEENALQWLSNPTRPAHSEANALRRSYNIRFTPAWIPLDHLPLQLELTATPIDLPPTMSAVETNSQLYAYVASPAKTSAPFSSPNSLNQVKRGLQTNLAGTASSMKSEVSSDMADLPSRLLYTFPWETTSLGPRAKWPQILNTMVQHMMANPIPVSTGGI